MMCARHPSRVKRQCATATPIAKRNSLLGGLAASAAIVSLSAFAWSYRDTRSIEKVAALASSLWWLARPPRSLALGCRL